jgi:tetratricopeptide (TPR) repeat protein
MRTQKTFIVLFCVCFAVAVLPLPNVRAAEIDEPAWVYKGRGDTYFRKGDSGRAIYEYKKALIRAGREDTVYPEVNLQLAKIYRDEGLYELALSQIEIVQSNADRLQIPDLIYEARYVNAEVFLLLERYNDALTVYERIIREDGNRKGYDMASVYDIWEDPDGTPLKRMRFAEAYLRIGIIKYQSNNYENSIPALKMALLYRHELEKTLKYLMYCYERTGDARAYEFLKAISEARNDTVRVKEETA